ncbi:sulfotransferase [Myxococcota bacterium]|nr:sulfotransferase [Myxococcota bacterium]
MLQSMKDLLSRRRYGAPVVIVSGLPRSGTSMMMKMLDAGGVPIMTDHVRQADVDNPKGYYEFERVKDMEKDPDKSWVRDGRGKAVKVISWLLKQLPDDSAYDIVFMRRDIDEVLASQNKMLKHRDEADATDDAAMAEAYRHHLAEVRILARKKPNWRMIEVRYDQAVQDPAAVAKSVNAFLGGRLDERKMVEAVDEKLYRNRKDGLTAPKPA